MFENNEWLPADTVIYFIISNQRHSSSLLLSFYVGNGTDCYNDATKFLRLFENAPIQSKAITRPFWSVEI